MCTDKSSLAKTMPQVILPKMGAFDYRILCMQVEKIPDAGMQKTLKYIL